MTREYVYSNPKGGNDVVIQDHSAGHNFGDGRAADDPHFNARPTDDAGNTIRNRTVEGTQGHYNFNK